jgi:hypothetical protein
VDKGRVELRGVRQQSKREHGGKEEKGKRGFGVGKEKRFVTWDGGRIVSGRNEAEGKTKECRDGERKERPKNRQSEKKREKRLWALSTTP